MRQKRNLIPGETLLDDVSSLLVECIGTRRQLNQGEAENIAIVAVEPGNCKRQSNPEYRSNNVAIVG